MYNIILHNRNMCINVYSYNGVYNMYIILYIRSMYPYDPICIYYCSFMYPPCTCMYGYTIYLHHSYIAMNLNLFFDVF